MMQVEDRFAVNGEVRLHYAAAGEGPLLVMLHGFPDFWGTWAPLMEALADRWRVVAADLRGYNLSDRPQGEAAYGMSQLVGDVAAVVKAEGRTRATLIGHDWGGAIAWNVATFLPALVERLVVLSMPHPAGFQQQVETNPVQQAGSAYVRMLLRPGFEKRLTAEGLLFWLRDEARRPAYLEALGRSDFGAMLNYYRANYPRPGEAPARAPSSRKVKVPVLTIHGLKDAAVAAAGHAGTWDRVAADSTLLTIPDADHWVHHDAEALVNRTIRDWLIAREDLPGPAAPERPPLAFPAF